MFIFTLIVLSTFMLWGILGVEARREADTRRARQQAYSWRWNIAYEKRMEGLCAQLRQTVAEGREERRLVNEALARGEEVYLVKGQAVFQHS